MFGITETADPNCNVHEVWPWFKCRFPLRAGVLLVAAIALLSFVCVVGLLCVILIRVIKRRIRRNAGRPLQDDEPTEPVALLFILAMAMELIQAFAHIMSARWAFQGATTPGAYCRTQAVLKQVGADGAALFNMFLAIMTLLRTLRPSVVIDVNGRRIVHGMITFVCVFWLLMIGVPAWTIPEYFGSTGPWCWIPPRLGSHGKVSKLRAAMGIASEYAWFLISSIVCFICYGTITWRWVREVRAQAFGAGRDVDRERIREGVVTIWYPIAYFVEIFPQSVLRLVGVLSPFTHRPPPSSGWIILTSVLFASSGWVNVLLWVVTGRDFGFSPASARDHAPRGSRSPTTEDAMKVHSTEIVTEYEGNGDYGSPALHYRPERHARGSSEQQMTFDDTILDSIPQLTLSSVHQQSLGIHDGTSPVPLPEAELLPQTFETQIVKSGS